ncbi:ATP-binding protein [Salinithrix halophila]|uniref:histidine kinase n=1 Tax=Salinithrix halophila TaxID=1485204 RepID=A0ABV8JBK8_9BACL
MMLIVAEMTLTFFSSLEETVEKKIGEKALSVAEVTAGMPELRQAFSESEPWVKIQPIAEGVRERTGAEFVVVGNKNGVRYSHPVPERIGREMVGGDNSPALREGKAYVSKAEGTLGPSLRGKAPIFDEEGRVIGIVSVGFLQEDIQEEVYGYLRNMIFPFLLLAMAIGTAGAILLARNVKKATFGLEPEEISSLYQERDAVIESVREGIIVTDRQGKITLVNQAAGHILSIDSARPLTGRLIKEVLPTTRIPEVLRSGETELDRSMSLAGREIVVNRYPIRQGDTVTGAVASFRLKSEMDELTRQLSQVSRYAEALRAQTHEFNNTLYTLSGLIQLGSQSEALELIHREALESQDWIQLIVKRIPDPWLGGILLGFHSRARELKVDLTIDPDSRLGPLPAHIQRQGLVTILGNLITNAFEAVEHRPEGERKVRLYIGEAGPDILLEVEDAGPGVPESQVPHLFEQGFSTKKGEKRGYGLEKVREAAEEMGGYVTVESGEWNGAVFSVSLPRRERLPAVKA